MLYRCLNLLVESANENARIAAEHSSSTTATLVLGALLFGLPALLLHFAMRSEDEYVKSVLGPTKPAKKWSSTLLQSPDDPERQRGSL